MESTLSRTGGGGEREGSTFTPFASSATNQTQFWIRRRKGEEGILRSEKGRKPFAEIDPIKKALLIPPLFFFLSPHLQFGITASSPKSHVQYTSMVTSLLLDAFSYKRIDAWQNNISYMFPLLFLLSIRCGHPKLMAGFLGMQTQPKTEILFTPVIFGVFLNFSCCCAVVSSVQHFELYYWDFNIIKVALL